jgi:hypothetical protein
MKSRRKKILIKNSIPGVVATAEQGEIVNNSDFFFPGALLSCILLPGAVACAGITV